MSSKISGTIAARVPNEVKEEFDGYVNESGSKMRDLMTNFTLAIRHGYIELDHGKIIIPSREGR